MADTGFKHIAVNRADDDDVVITAGLVGEAAGDGPEDGPDGGVAEGPAAGPERDTADGPAGESGGESGNVSDGASSGEGPAENGTAATSARRARPAGERAETTLEDLEGEKMPLVQRIVIIAALVCIIGAIVYYFAFMR